MDLRDAIELIYMVRIRHQALDIENGDKTPTGRQRITEPGISGYGVGTSTSTGSPSRDSVLFT